MTLMLMFWLYSLVEKTAICFLWHFGNVCLILIAKTCENINSNECLLDWTSFDPCILFPYCFEDSLMLLTYFFAQAALIFMLPLHNDVILSRRWFAFCVVLLIYRLSKNASSHFIVLAWTIVQPILLCHFVALMWYVTQRNCHLFDMDVSCLKEVHRKL